MAGYRGESWNNGELLVLDTGKWCFHWRRDFPIIFAPLRAREGMSFVEATELREDPRQFINDPPKKSRKCVVQ